MKPSYVIYACIYCPLNATSESDFEQLFCFIKIFKEYLKHSLQNSLNFLYFYFSIFTVTCESTLNVPTIATRAYLNPYPAKVENVTGFSRCK